MNDINQSFFGQNHVAAVPCGEDKYIVAGVVTMAPNMKYSNYEKVQFEDRVLFIGSSLEGSTTSFRQLNAVVSLRPCDGVVTRVGIQRDNDYSVPANQRNSISRSNIWREHDTFTFSDGMVQRSTRDDASLASQFQFPPRRR